MGSRSPTRSNAVTVLTVRREISMGSIPAPLWQADASPEVRKPWVGVKIVQTRVCGQIDGQIIAPMLVRPLQPGERLIFFAEARVNDSDVIGRDIAARRQLFQMIQHPLRFRPCSPISRVGGPTLGLLGRHVGWSTHDRAGFGQPESLEQAAVPRVWLCTQTMWSHRCMSPPAWRLTQVLSPRRMNNLTLRA
jgi:hypothetical protein